MGSIRRLRHWWNDVALPKFLNASPSRILSSIRKEAFSNGANEGEIYRITGKKSAFSLFKVRSAVKKLEVICWQKPKCAINKFADSRRNFCEKFAEAKRNSLASFVNRQALFFKYLDFSKIIRSNLKKKKQMFSKAVIGKCDGKRSVQTRFVLFQSLPSPNNFQNCRRRRQPIKSSVLFISKMVPKCP